MVESLLRLIFSNFETKLSKRDLFVKNREILREILPREPDNTSSVSLTWWKCEFLIHGALLPSLTHINNNENAVSVCHSQLKLPIVDVATLYAFISCFILASHADSGVADDNFERKNYEQKRSSL